MVGNCSPVLWFRWSLRFCILEYWLDIWKWYRRDWSILTLIRLRSLFGFIFKQVIKIIHELVCQLRLFLFLLGLNHFRLTVSPSSKGLYLWYITNEFWCAITTHTNTFFGLALRRRHDVWFGNNSFTRDDSFGLFILFTFNLIFRFDFCISKSWWLDLRFSIPVLYIWSCNTKWLLIRWITYSRSWNNHGWIRHLIEAGDGATIGPLCWILLRRLHILILVSFHLLDLDPIITAKWWSFLSICLDLLVIDLIPFLNVVHQSFV